MAQWYRATVTLPHVNGLPKDAVANTYAFRVAGTADRDLVAADIDVRLTAFYSAWKNSFSSDYDPTNMSVKVYDMTDDVPRFPYYDELLSVAAPVTTNNNMPAEVALVLSFEGARTSGVNMRRRRGRVYLGPLQLASTDSQQVPSTLVSTIVTAADDNLLTPESPNGLSEWAVYSPYTHHGIPVGTKITKEDPEIPDFLDASFTPVVRCWVDNAWDTQRRRGVSATSRTIVST